MANKHINELDEIISPSISGNTIYDDGNKTYKLSLNNLKNKLTSNNLNVTGSVSASYFSGDGSGLFNLPVPSGSYAVTGANTFTNKQIIRSLVTGSQKLLELRNTITGTTSGSNLVFSVDSNKTNGVEIIGTNITYDTQVPINLTGKELNFNANDKPQALKIDASGDLIVPNKLVSTNTINTFIIENISGSSLFINFNKPNYTSSGILLDEFGVSLSVGQNVMRFDKSGNLNIPNGIYKNNSPINILSSSQQITNLGFATTSSLYPITGSKNQISTNNGTQSLVSTVAISGSMIIGANGGLQFGSSFFLGGGSEYGFIGASGDGVFRMSNAASNGFNRLVFGSIINTHPSIKKDGTGFSLRNGDDTSFTFVSASKFITSGGTSNHFVKGDGSLDSSTYLTPSNSTQTLTNLGFKVTNSFIDNVTIFNGSGSSPIDFNFNDTNIFYLTSSVGTTTWNIQNIPTASNKVFEVKFIIPQGVTPYSASQYSFNGTPVSVKWENGVIPTGSSNVTNLIKLLAINNNSIWDVLGNMSTYS